MYIDFEQTAERDRYKLLTATVVPRPIALVTTRNEDGGTNAAPFSFFNVVSSDPPLVVLGLETRPDHTLKDTTMNIRRTGEFVVQMVDEAIAEAMVVCAASFPPGVSEIPAAGFSLEKSEKIDVDRIVEAPISFICRRVTALQFSKTRDLVIGEVLGMVCRDGLIDPDNYHVDWNVYQPIGRLYASHYTRLHDRFSHDIPSMTEIGDANPR